MRWMDVGGIAWRGRRCWEGSCARATYISQCLTALPAGAEKSAGPDSNTCHSEITNFKLNEGIGSPVASESPILLHKRLSSPVSIIL